jgi:hypothetical protein
MRLLRATFPIAAVFLLAFSVSLFSLRAARGSDHQDSPTVVSNPLADITDVFAFPDPNDASKVALVMDVRPLIPAGMYGKKALDPNVLYQFKIAGGVANKNYAETAVVQFKANSTSTNQKITLYGPSAPNEVGTTNTLVKKTGTFAFGKVSTLDGGNVKVFVGPRRDPFFFDLAQFFKIVPDRNFMNHPSPPPPTAASFRFASKNEPIVLNGVNYGTAGSNGCVIANPHDYLASYDVLSVIVEMPKTMLEPASGSLGVIGLWATTATPDGQAE